MPGRKCRPVQATGALPRPGNTRLPHCLPRVAQLWWRLGRLGRGWLEAEAAGELHLLPPRPWGRRLSRRLRPRPRARLLRPQLPNLLHLRGRALEEHNAERHYEGDQGHGNARRPRALRHERAPHGVDHEQGATLRDALVHCRGVLCHQSADPALENVQDQEQRDPAVPAHQEACAALAAALGAGAEVGPLPASRALGTALGVKRPVKPDPVQAPPRDERHEEEHDDCGHQAPSLQVHLLDAEGQTLPLEDLFREQRAQDRQAHRAQHHAHGQGAAGAGFGRGCVFPRVGLQHRVGDGREGHDEQGEPLQPHVAPAQHPPAGQGGDRHVEVAQDGGHRGGDAEDVCHIAHGRGEREEEGDHQALRDPPQVPSQLEAVAAL
mmetsp:Transcript_81974/g.254459  ORF Transcript_81974/g.254459 Transcript_81974/m.254459 type:complete len:380 (-) Transcript_81974:1330-2469(-)